MPLLPIINQTERNDQQKGLRAVPASIRVVMISKACVVGAYQRKLEEIAAHPGIELTVIVPPYWQDARGKLTLERAHTDGYTLTVEKMRFNGNFHLHHYPALKARIAESRPDIIHIDEEPYNLAAFQALRLAQRNNARSLFFSWHNIERRYPPPFNWLERYVLNHVDYALVGSEEAAQVWQAKGYEGPLTVLPQFGVDPAIFAPVEKRASRTHFTIGYAGRLVPEKGLNTLIKAAALLPGKWVLRLLGAGPQRGELYDMAGLYNIGGALSIEEPIPSTQMPGWYRQLDALVLPSRTRPNWKEQFGRVLIEAMACGVPVVGSDSGAIPGVIGPTGLIFPEGDEEMLAAHLTRLMTDDTLHRALAEAGRQRVLNHFTQAQVASRTVDVYRSVMRAS